MRWSPRLATRERESGWTFALVLCGLYCAFLVFAAVHHEMWRDEVHAWTLARLAQGFWELVTGDRAYEGHPPLWFWYLRLWTWFVKAAWGVQAATIAAATAAALLLVRFAPFPRYLKVALLFSYYFGFEYTVMARNYVLGWLCVCLFCALYHPARIRHFSAAVALGLLSLTSVYGLIMSICLLCYLASEQTRIDLAARSGAPPAMVTVRVAPRMLMGVLVASLMIAFCVVTVEPPEPNPFAPAFSWSSLSLASLPDILYRYTAGVLPWRRLVTGEYWCCSFVTFWERQSVWPWVVGSGLLILAVAALYPSWRLMLTYGGFVTVAEVLEQVRHEGSPRHWGHFFLAFVVVCWLLRSAFPKRSHWPSTVLLTSIAIVQIESFAVAIIIDTREVFSGARETAAFIERSNLQDLPIVAGPDYCVSTVTGYLRRPFIAVETDEVHQTVAFHSRRRSFSTRSLVDKSIAVSRERNSPVLLICNQGLPDVPAGTQRTLLFSSRPGTIGDEVFSVYRVEAN